MNLILHQFQTDTRHFRWRLVALWFSFAAEPMLGAFDTLPSFAFRFSDTLLWLWQIFFASSIIVQLVQSDSLAGTEAAWLTRPLRRRHLFWAKTAFVVVYLLVPRLASQGIGWAMRGYSQPLWLAAAAESLLFSVTLVFAVAALAAFTRDLPRFFLAAGIVIGGMFAWAAAVSMLWRAGVIDGPAWVAREKVALEASALTAAMLVLMAGVLLAWILQARARSWRGGAACFTIGLLAFPVVNVVWSKSFLRVRITKSAPLSVMIVEPDERIGEPQSQQLWSEVIVDGVPPRHVAIAQDVSASIFFDGHWEPARINGLYEGNFDRVRPLVSAQSGEYFRVIRGFFPTNTLWFNGLFRDRSDSAFYDASRLRRFTNAPLAGEFQLPDPIGDTLPAREPRGHLRGEIELDLYAVKKVAESPLRRATFSALPGVRVTIQRVEPAEGAVLVTVDECVAQLMLDRSVDTVRSGSIKYRGTTCIYVLYHPGSGEACLVGQMNSPDLGALNGEAHLSMRLRFPYPALRQRLAGMSAAEWMRESHLCVFAPVYAGTSRLTFHRENFVLMDSSTSFDSEREKLAGAEALERATLPGNATAGELEAYLDRIASNLPDPEDNALGNAVEKKLLALGTNGLPALLRRLPLAQKVEGAFVLPAVRQLVTRAQLPELRAALERDNDLVTVFLEKHWEADARDVLVAKLRDHRQPLPPEVLCIAAEARDPTTYEGLRWHFVRLERGHDRVIAVLEKCPGFDVAAAVRAAWARAQLGLTSRSDLAAAAAKQGLPDALSLAVMSIEQSSNENRNQRELAQLAALTGYHGPVTNTLVWLGANLEKFHFDAREQRYVLSIAR